MERAKSLFSIHGGIISDDITLKPHPFAHDIKLLDDIKNMYNKTKLYDTVFNVKSDDFTNNVTLVCFIKIILDYPKTPLPDKRW